MPDELQIAVSIFEMDPVDIKSSAYDKREHSQVEYTIKRVPMAMAGGGLNGDWLTVESVLNGLIDEGDLYEPGRYLVTALYSPVNEPLVNSWSALFTVELAPPPNRKLVIV